MLPKLLLYVLGLTTPWLILFFGSVNYYSDFIKSRVFPSVENNELFDFIVVGSGSGGATVAYRLSTNKNVKVLLLEAGGDPSILNHIPFLAMEMLGYESTDWVHKTVPQKHACWGLKNNQSTWHAGKVLGGSTILNFMMYLRGHPSDYDNWANLTGDGDWNYANLIPLFKKSLKSYKGEYPENKKHYEESKYGFLHVESPQFTPFMEEIIEGGEQAGFPAIDINGGAQRRGLGRIDATRKNGQRHSMYFAVISELEKRPNVKVSRFSHATKIKLDGNLGAEGVWYYHHGVKKLARASKEVIISAGAVKSPHILMLSGIGPKAHLKSVGIKSKLDLPVGRNLHDHLLTPIIPIVIDKPLSFSPDRDLWPGIFKDYFMDGVGPLSVPFAAHSQFFYSSAVAKKSGEENWPDIQSFFMPCATFSAYSAAFTRALSFNKGSLGSVVDPFIGQDSMSYFLGLVRPKSRGEILLKSRNPMDTLLIDPHYLEHPDDISALVDGIKASVSMFENSQAYQTVNTRLVKGLTECEGFKFKSDDYWECAARHWTVTIWHPVGTCRMGDPRDKTTVVDSKLRVLNTKGLRVVDASIMPVIVNANTMAPTIMIGEKASNDIREYWAQQYAVSNLIHFSFFTKTAIRQCFYSQMM